MNEFSFFLCRFQWNMRFSITISLIILLSSFIEIKRLENITYISEPLLIASQLSLSSTTDGRVSTWESEISGKVCRAQTNCIRLNLSDYPEILWPLGMEFVCLFIFLLLYTLLDSLSLSES